MRVTFRSCECLLAQFPGLSPWGKNSFGNECSVLMHVRGELCAQRLFTDTSIAQQRIAPV